MGYSVVADAGTVYGNYFCDTCTMIRYDPEITQYNDIITEGSLREYALEIEEEATTILNEETIRLGTF